MKEQIPKKDHPISTELTIRCISCDKQRLSDKKKKFIENLSWGKWVDLKYNQLKNTVSFPRNSHFFLNIKKKVN